MSELLSIADVKEVYNVVALLTPGVIITFVRSKFLTGRTRTISEATMEYVVVSIIYYALVVPIFEYFPSWEPRRHLLLVFVFPVVFGAILGCVAQRDLVSKLLSTRALSWLGLKIAHPIPTSWDYLFANLKSGVWILVTLKSGERIFGLFGGQSFASSDLSRRDLYIEDIRDENWSVLEQDGRTRGIWLSEDEIRLVEIIPAGEQK